MDTDHEKDIRNHDGISGGDSFDGNLQFCGIYCNRGELVSLLPVRRSDCRRAYHHLPEEQIREDVHE